MAKPGELTYFRDLDEQSAASLASKPFSAGYKGRHVTDIGMLRSLLPDPPARLLDLGCGNGWTSYFFTIMGYEVVGQDVAPDMIQAAQENSLRFDAPSIRFVVSDYESLDFHDEFEAACFYDSLHHAEDERLALEAVYRALKPGGVLVTHEPGKGHAENEVSIDAVKRFGVTEKDMPAWHIIALATEIGFSSAQYFPFASEIVESLMRQNARQLVSSKQGFSGWIERIQRSMRVNRQRRSAKRRVGRLIDNAIEAGGITVLTK